MNVNRFPAIMLRESDQRSYRFGIFVAGDDPVIDDFERRVQPIPGKEHAEASIATIGGFDNPHGVPLRHIGRDLERGPFGSGLRKRRLDGRALGEAFGKVFAVIGPMFGNHHIGSAFRTGPAQR